ncbi:MAG: galactarate dehydrogenase [Pseudomonadota bacterium]|jgi:galactarate dehydratase
MNHPRAIRTHPADNVAIVANDGGLPAGAQVEGITLIDKVPQGHKFNLLPLRKGDAVLRYNVPIGYAKEDIAAGRWVHERLLDMPAARELDGQVPLPMATVKPAPTAPLDGFSFDGFVNPDGSVGTRNILAITTTVQCVAGVVAQAVKRIKSDLLPQFPHVDDVVGLEHSYGCGVAIDAPDAVIPIRTLRNISRNPNFGGEVMVVSLGCEKLQPDRLMPPGSFAIHDERDAKLDTVCLQDDGHVGFDSMIQHIVERARVHMQRLNARRRQPVPASKLVVGVQCGGSDAFSGLTANPAVGAMADLVVRAGGTVMFSENTEVRDAVEQLTSRAASPEVAQGIVKELAWYDAYLQRGQVDRSANTTPGNKAGGLSNIVEKAMGSIIKSGSQAISGVLPPGEKLSDHQLRGLVYAATPASDFICGTLQLAAGMNLHVFTTGRGTPYGLAECPVVKVATRSDLARRWHDLMDVNAGRVADGELNTEQLGFEMFQLMLDVASGRVKTCAEKLQLHNSLVLFNPAPVT